MSLPPPSSALFTRVGRTRAEVNRPFFFYARRWGLKWRLIRRAELQIKALPIAREIPTYFTALRINSTVAETMGVQSPNSESSDPVICARELANGKNVSSGKSCFTLTSAAPFSSAASSAFFHNVFTYGIFARKVCYFYLFARAYVTNLLSYESRLWLNALRFFYLNQGDCFFLASKRFYEVEE